VAVDDRGLGAAHAAQEEVEHPAEVLLRGVRRQSPAQEAVQHHGVEQRLERVMAVQHRRRHLGVTVVGGGDRHPRLTEQVGLVVDHHVAVSRWITRGHAQHHVDRAGQVATQRLVTERTGQLVGVRRERVVGRQVRGQQRRQVAEVYGVAHAARNPAWPVAAGERELEVELAQPIAERDVDQPEAGPRRSERRELGGQQRLGQLVGRDADRPPLQLLADVADQLAAQVGRLGVGLLEHGVHQAAERGAARQIGHRADDSPTREQARFGLAAAAEL
jgi:hypothetical protein